MNAHRLLSCCSKQHMEHHLVPVTPLLSRFAKRRRFLGRALLAALGILLALALDFSPVVPEAKPPIAEQAQRVRGIVEQLRAQLRGNNGLATLRLDRADLTSAATLASALKKFGRIDGRIDNNAMTVRVSRPFGFLWVNGEMRIGSSAKGFPDVALKIGDLPLGRTLSRWIVRLARHMVRRRGVDVPPVKIWFGRLTFKPTRYRSMFICRLAAHSQTTCQTFAANRSMPHRQP
jgi:hypothetical protein